MYFEYLQVLFKEKREKRIKDYISIKCIRGKKQKVSKGQSLLVNPLVLKNKEDQVYSNYLKSELQGLI